MKHKVRMRALVFSLIGTMGLAACSESPPPAQRLMDSDIPDTPRKGGLLMGWDSKAKSWSGYCVQPKGYRSFTAERANRNRSIPDYAELFGSPTSKLVFSQDMTETQLRDALSGNLKVGVDFPQVSAGAGASYARSNGADEFSLSYTLSVDVVGRSWVLKEGTSFELSPFGEEVLKGTQELINTQTGSADPEEVRQYVTSRCGDEFISQIDFGASMLATMKVTFRNKAEKESFRGNLSVNLVGGAFEVSGDFEKTDESVRKNARVTLDAIQVGGMPSKFSTALDSAKLTGCNVLDKEGMANCFAAFEKFVAYAAGTASAPLVAQGATPVYANGLPAQLNDDTGEGYAVLGYRSVDYSSHNLQMAAAPIGPFKGEHIINARKALKQKYFEVAKHHDRAQLLLSRFQVSRSQEKELTNLIRKTQDLLTQMALTLDACYTKIDQTCLDDIHKVEDEAKGRYAYDESALVIIPENFHDWCKVYITSNAPERSGAGDNDPNQKGDPAPTDQAALHTIGEIMKAATGRGQDWLNDVEAIDCREVADALSSLSALNLANKSITELEPFQSLNHLEAIDLSDNYIQDLAPLKKTYAWELNLQGNKALKSLDDLRGNEYIEQLDISRSGITDISALRSIEGLSVVRAQDLRRLDVSPLADSPFRLAEIDLTGTKRVAGLADYLQASKAKPNDTTNIIVERTALERDHNEEQVRQLCSQMANVLCL